jgi:hypothetical protein
LTKGAAHGIEGTMNRLRCAAAFAVTAACLVSSGARAQPADEHAAAQALVAEVVAAPQAAAATADAVAHAKDALERATRLRVAGDEAHAKAADGVALEWAQTARDVVHAADAESRAAELRKKAVDAQAQLDRSRALVEAAVASIGRLQAELAQASAAPPADHAAVEVHDGEPAPNKKGAAKKPATAGARTNKTDAGKTP